MFGWSLARVPLRVGLAIVLPIMAATAWGLFNVPGDPSRSGQAPVVVPGLLRLALELTIFTGAVLALLRTKHTSLAIALGVVVAAHYALSYDRIAWLLRR